MQRMTAKEHSRACRQPRRFRSRRAARDLPWPGAPGRRGACPAAPLSRQAREGATTRMATAPPAGGCPRGLQVGGTLPTHADARHGDDDGALNPTMWASLHCRLAGTCCNGQALFSATPLRRQPVGMRDATAFLISISSMVDTDPPMSVTIAEGDGHQTGIREGSQVSLPTPLSYGTVRMPGDRPSTIVEKPAGGPHLPRSVHRTAAPRGRLARSSRPALDSATCRGDPS